MTRAIAAAGYRHGAKFVDVAYFDLHVKRARLLHADEDTLDYVPPLLRRPDPGARATCTRRASG